VLAGKGGLAGSPLSPPYKQVVSDEVAWIYSSATKSCGGLSSRPPSAAVQISAGVSGDATTFEAW